MFWYLLSALSVIAAGSTAAGEGGESISLSFSLKGQYEDQSSSSSTHRVFVGASGGLRFRPQYVEAAVGDLITFEFLALNHSIKQSSFDFPCASDGGFETEFWQYNPHNSSRQTVDMLVTTTTPQWFYCQQTIPWPHCSAGMVFAINPGNHWGEFLSHAYHRPATTSTVSSLTQMPSGRSTNGADAGSTGSVHYTYDPQTSSTCDPATSSTTDSDAGQSLLPIVIGPLNTAPRDLKRRTPVSGAISADNGQYDGVSLWRTAVGSRLGSTHRLDSINTAASGVRTALSTGGATGTTVSWGDGICTSSADTTGTWHWPSAVPSVQSVAALPSAPDSIIGIFLVSTLLSCAIAFLLIV